MLLIACESKKWNVDYFIIFKKNICRWTSHQLRAS
jgi:hypothetical protein